jgi:hypothetical protein
MYGVHSIPEEETLAEEINSAAASGLRRRNRKRDVERYNISNIMI